VDSSLILLASLDGLRRRLIPPELLELKNELVQALESDEGLPTSKRCSVVGLLRDLSIPEDRQKRGQIAELEEGKEGGNDDSLEVAEVQLWEPPAKPKGHRSEA